MDVIGQISRKDKVEENVVKHLLLSLDSLESRCSLGYRSPVEFLLCCKALKLHHYDREGLREPRGVGLGEQGGEKLEVASEIWERGRE